jgi:hypothetical protein
MSYRTANIEGTEMEGIYSVTFRGAVEWGFGMLLLRGGRIVGADVGGVLFDGSYRRHGDELKVDVVMTVPPGAVLVQGTAPKPKPYTVAFEDVVPMQSIRDGTPVLIQMPPGPVNIIFKLLRALEE